MYMYFYSITTHVYHIKPCTYMYILMYNEAHCPTDFEDYVYIELRILLYIHVHLYVI